MSKKDWSWGSSNRYGVRGGKMAEGIDAEDMGFDTSESYCDSNEEEWFEEEKEEEEEEQPAEAKQQQVKEQQHQHVDPASRDPVSTATAAPSSGSLNDFLTAAANKKTNVHVGTAAVKATNTTTHAQTSGNATTLSKENIAKMRQELISHGIQNPPKAQAALQKMHQNILGGEAAAREQQLLVTSCGCGKAYEEFPEELWTHVLEYLKFRDVWAVARTNTWMKMVASSAPNLPEAVVVRTFCDLKVSSKPFQLSENATEIENYVRWLRYTPIVEETGMWRLKQKKPAPMHFVVESRAKVSTRAKTNADAPLNEFPWDVLSSITYRAATELKKAWSDYHGLFLSRIEYLIARSEGRGETGPVVRREKDPEGNKQHLEIIARYVAYYDRIIQTTAVNVWLAKLVEVKQWSATLLLVKGDDHETTPLEGDEDFAAVMFCRIKANEAAGMYRTARKLAEDALTKQPWTLSDVGTDLANSIGVPQTEADWNESVSALPRIAAAASKESLLKADEVDVTAIVETNDDEAANDKRLDKKAQQLRQRWMALRRQHSRVVFKTTLQWSHAPDLKAQQQRDLAQLEAHEDFLKSTHTYVQKPKPMSEAERLQKLKDSMTPSQWRLWKQNNNVFS